MEMGCQGRPRWLKSCPVGGGTFSGLWDREIESGSNPRFRFHPHSSSIRFDDLLSQCKPHSGARNVFAVQAVEDLENLSLVLGLNADAIIPDREHPGVGLHF